MMKEMINQIKRKQQWTQPSRRKNNSDGIH